MEGINESAIADSIKSVSIKKTEIILNQMKNCVCKIHNGQKKGTGFFAKLSFKNQLIKVLITNNHVLGENEILPGNTISISLNNKKSIRNIKIDSERKRYTNKNYDTTIIELNEKDNINNYLTFDKQILERINSEKVEISVNTNKGFNNLYEKESIYILNYFEEIRVSYGLLNSINGYQIKHKCSTTEGASGSPILSLESNEVIGIHNKGSNNNFPFNFGILLVEPLIDFYLKNKNTFTPKSNMNECQKYQNNTNQNIDKIYNDIINYFNNERDIFYKINVQNQNNYYQGFLVDKNWVDNWRRYSYYDHIKFYFFDKNINNGNLMKQYILENLINNNLNYNEINNVEIFILKNSNQLKLPENQDKSFVLLNNIFLRQFPIKLNITPISFYLSYKTIKLITLNQIFSFQANNNIIINKRNNFIDIQGQKYFNKNVKEETNKINQIKLINKNLVKTEEYIPYSCIPQLEKNDRSFEATQK